MGKIKNPVELLQKSRALRIVVIAIHWLSRFSQPSWLTVRAIILTKQTARRCAVVTPRAHRARRLLGRLVKKAVRTS